MGSVTVLDPDARAASGQGNIVRLRLLADATSLPCNTSRLRGANSLATAFPSPTASLLNGESIIIVAGE